MIDWKCNRRGFKHEESAVGSLGFFHRRCSRQCYVYDLSAECGAPGSGVAFCSNGSDLHFAAGSQHAVQKPVSKYRADQQNADAFDLHNSCVDSCSFLKPAQHRMGFRGVECFSNIGDGVVMRMVPLGTPFGATPVFLRDLSGCLPFEPSAFVNCQRSDCVSTYGKQKKGGYSRCEDICGDVACIHWHN